MVHTFLGSSLLVLQLSFAVVLAVGLWRARSGDGVSVPGEALWVATGVGWAAWALSADDVPVLLSGSLATVSSTVNWAGAVWFAKRSQSAVAAVSFVGRGWFWFVLVAGLLVGGQVVSGVAGLAFVLSAVGAVQFVPYLVAAVGLFRSGGVADGVPVVGVALRLVYTVGWTVYAAGDVVWSNGSPVAWPLFVWGVAGSVAFLFQLLTIVRNRRMLRTVPGPAAPTKLGHI